MTGDLLSMTGFGSAQLEREGFVIRAEIRTVNHKHLQVRLRLPSAHHNLEPRLEGLVKQSLQRGSVQLAVHLDASGAVPEVQVQTDLASRYAQDIQALGQTLGLPDPVTLQQVVSLPGVLHVTEAASDGEREAGWIEEAVRAAIEDLLRMRTVEGQAMLRDLRGRHQEIEAVRGAIAARAPQIVREHAEKLHERVRTLLDSGSPVAEGDLAREVALLADRLDVSEELARLAAHLELLDQLLSQGGPIGRKLDFLAQEFMREANTIGSKCSDAETAHQVVEMKTAIERLREQIQNVE